MAADAPASGQQGGITGLVLPILLFVAVFYFMIFRPQKKKQQQHDNMIASITRGDTVISAGGFFGRVCDVLDDSYVVEIADGVKVRILKSSISTRKDSPDSPKPLRHKRKKKREPMDQGSAPAENETSTEDSVPVAIKDWVTDEESGALFSDSGDGTHAKDEGSAQPMEITVAGGKDEEDNKK